MRALLVGTLRERTLHSFSLSNSPHARAFSHCQLFQLSLVPLRDGRRRAGSETSASAKTNPAQKCRTTPCRFLSHAGSRVSSKAKAPLPLPFFQACRLLLKIASMPFHVQFCPAGARQDSWSRIYKIWRSPNRTFSLLPSFFQRAIFCGQLIR